MPERKILDGVSFVVPAGKSVAIVGTSGSGKASDIPCFFLFSAHVPYPGNVICKQLKVPSRLCTTDCFCTQGMWISLHSIDMGDKHMHWNFVFSSLSIIILASPDDFLCSTLDFKF